LPIPKKCRILKQNDYICHNIVILNKNGTGVAGECPRPCHDGIFVWFKSEVLNVNERVEKGD